MELRAQDISMPALLRAARMAYRGEIRLELARAGFEDVPKNGILVVGAIARSGAPLRDVIRHLGVSKQAAGQLVDALVLRGYLEREVDASDRRRLTIRLSERGRGAAAAARAAVERVDARLARHVPREWVDHTRATLLALIGDSDA